MRRAATNDHFHNRLICRFSFPLIVQSERCLNVKKKNVLFSQQFKTQRCICISVRRKTSSLMKNDFTAYSAVDRLIDLSLQLEEWGSVIPTVLLLATMKHFQLRSAVKYNPRPLTISDTLFWWTLTEVKLCLYQLLMSDGRVGITPLSWTCCSLTSVYLKYKGETEWNIAVRILIVIILFFH